MKYVLPLFNVAAGILCTGLAMNAAINDHLGWCVVLLLFGALNVAAAVTRCALYWGGL